jgi:uncharacterized phage-associated protein
MKTAEECADVLLVMSVPDYGDVLTNLKLQKLLYYSQGVHLGLHGTPLFADDFIAWEHGPVIPALYRKYKSAGASGIMPPMGIVLPEFTEAEIAVFDEVYRVFGQFSAWKLREMTHNESPWLETAQNEVIPKALIQKYFKENVVS